MLIRLIVAEVLHRPGRAVLLLGGYALGVAVMVVLLAVGEAMLVQARDSSLLGGGDLVVVPAGISAEMLKAGGATSLFLGLDQARFLQRRMLESERAREEFGIDSSSPVLDGKLVVLQTGDREVQALASAEIPSRAAAAGAAPALLSGSWSDSPSDRRWVNPSAQELYTSMDRLHLPPPEAAGDSTWAEWHYFNVLLDPDRWIYISIMLGGQVGTPGGWGGRVLLTLREADGSHRSVTSDFLDTEVRFDTMSPDLSFADGSGVMLRNGIYRVHAAAGDINLDLEVTPTPGLYFPPAQLGGSEFVSGYVVPALRAEASGRICLPLCEEIVGARAYHDHNWGVWRDVSWEWGTASSEEMSLLYGVVRGPDAKTEEPLFAYLVDARGVRGLYRPGQPETLETTPTLVDGTLLQVPRIMELSDDRRGLRIVLEISSAHVTHMEREQWPWFVQMRGTARVEEGGLPVSVLEGFFETYLQGTEPQR